MAYIEGNFVTNAEELCVSSAVNSYYGERLEDLAKCMCDANVSSVVRAVVSAHIKQLYMQNVPYGIQRRVTWVEMDQFLRVDGQVSLVGVLGLSIQDHQRIQDLCSLIDKRNGFVPDYTSITC